MKAQPHEISLLYVAYPLAMHRFALGAARAAECAYHFGRFREWVDDVYDKQDSLGLKTWSSYAQEAGIPDTTGISLCARNPAPVARIRAGIALGNRIHIAGTPTVIVDGWRFSSPPNEEELTRVVKAIAKGQAPFGTRSHGTGAAPGSRGGQ